MRQAANLAIDREGMNEALFLGHCKITDSIIPDSFDFYWQPPDAVHDLGQGAQIADGGRLSERLRCRPVLLRQLLREHGRGISGQPAADRHPNPLQPIERAGFLAATAERNTTAELSRAQAAPLATQRRGLPPSSSKVEPSSMAATPTSTNSSRSRPPNSITKKRNEDPGQDAAARLREGDLCADLAARLHQRIGPRVGESAFNLIPGFAYTAPFEDITIKCANGATGHGPIEDMMKQFIIRRISYSLLSLFLLSVTIFFFVRVTGDPAALLVEPGASQADIAAIHQQFGLDRPLVVQYGLFMSSLFQGDLGKSFYYQTPVMELYLSGCRTRCCSPLSR